MAKKKKKALPKKIAGVKIPKTLRKSAGSLEAMLETRLGREILASGLMAMAGSLLGSKNVRHAAADAGHDAVDAGSAVAQAAGELGRAAGERLADAAKHVLPESLVRHSDDNHPSANPSKHIPADEQAGRKADDRPAGRSPEPKGDGDGVRKR